MATDLDAAVEEWLLLSTTVARMSELNPAYRTYPGYARRDLETAIKAGRIAMRGRPTWPRESPPRHIVEPILSKYRLDPVSNTLSERAPGPNGGTYAYVDLEVNWPEAEAYMRLHAVPSTAAEAERRWSTTMRTSVSTAAPNSASDHSGSTNGAEKRCEAWLMDLAEKDGGAQIAWKAKNYWKKEAINRFKGRLSVRGFDRAWARVGEKYPHILKAGRRPRTRN